MSEWGDWIEHDGSGYPVPAGTYVNTIDGEGLDEYFTVMHAQPNFNAWTWSQDWYKYHPEWAVIRYRVRRPLGLTILESVLNDLPAPTKPTVPA